MGRINQEDLPTKKFVTCCSTSSYSPFVLLSLLSVHTCVIIEMCFLSFFLNVYKYILVLSEMVSRNDLKFPTVLLYVSWLCCTCYNSRAEKFCWGIVTAGYAWIVES